MAKGQGRKERFEWVEVGADVMLAARRRKGAGREVIARKLNVSLKTYERYERTGRVPVHQLKKVAVALGLEIVQDPTPKVVMVKPRDEDRLAAVERIARETRAEVMSLRREVAAFLALVLRHREDGDQPPR
jgi:transcriptional regulator with XRE-family HTH domain